MIREVTMEEISDGRLYGPNDMVKADCADCRGCSACCRGMGSSIVLDPLDIHRLVTGLGQPFGQLLQGKLELNVADGIILPNLKMAGEEECCVFLNEEGRCSIHAFRPGICRLFPLGRIYEEVEETGAEARPAIQLETQHAERSFRYFLQVHECKNQNRTKVKVRKWIDMPDFAKYERFVAEWHYFLKDLQKLIVLSDEAGNQASPHFDEPEAKKISLRLLNEFYIKPFAGIKGGTKDTISDTTQPSAQPDFYVQFAARLRAVKAIYGLR